MKIGIIATHSYPIPTPNHTGDVVILDLATALSEAGHDVTLYAAVGTQRPHVGRVLPMPTSMGTGSPLPAECEEGCWAAHQDALRQEDVVHDFSIEKRIFDHLYNEGRRNLIATPLGGYWASPRNAINVVTWSQNMRERGMRGAGDYEGSTDPSIPQVWINNAQRKILDARVVHGGIDTGFYAPSDYTKDTFFLWMNRWHPAKGYRLAIDLARATGIELVMAGEHPDRDSAYQRQCALEAVELARGLSNVRFEWLPADPDHHVAKREMYRRARALLYTGQFQEPFGLAQVEALACGTPVIGTRFGSVPEVIEHGVTGYVVDNTVEALAEATKLVDAISPEKCREEGVRRYDRSVMAANYLALYEAVARGETWGGPAPIEIATVELAALEIDRSASTARTTAQRATPKVTVTLGTDRPGGLDVALCGLAGQTFKDFEIIIVDGRYHTRHAAVLDAVRRYGITQPVFHVPNHRYSDTPWGVQGAGYNTGFALAAGEIVVMLLDYAYAPPGWLAAHVEHQERGAKIVLGPHEYRTLTPADFAPKNGAQLLDFLDRNNVLGVPVDVALKSLLDQREKIEEISAFVEPFTPERLALYPREAGDVKCDLPTGPLSYDYFNTKNESFPLAAVLDVNGADEHYDLGRGPSDPDLGLRLSRTGLDTWNVNEAMVHCLNPRRILSNLNILSLDDGARLPPPHQDRFTLQEGYAYFETVKASGAVRAPNPIDLRDLRERIWHWRELSQHEEPIIPKNIVSDREYRRTTKASSVAKHSFDPRTQAQQYVWHKDSHLESIVRHVIETAKPDRWVETGTHMGWTSLWVAQNYPWLPIYTVEVDADYYAKAKENLAPYPQAHVVLGSSPDFLWRLLPSLKRGLTLFWLDAHWWPPVPLREECQIIAQLDRYVCLIDDFASWGPDFGGDIFYSTAPNHGDAYLNDISYVASALGQRYHRPIYTPRPGYKGVGLFQNGVDYTPPADLMKEETLDEFLATQPSNAEMSAFYNVAHGFERHPSCGHVPR